MNKNILIAIAAVAVLAVGAAVYYFMPVGDDATLARRALESRGSITCDFVDEHTGETATMYIRNGDVRVDGVSYGVMEEDVEAETAEVPTYMLLKEDSMYVWADGEPQGIMSSLGAEEDSGSLVFENYEDEDEFRDDFDRGEFDCSRGASASLFDLPSDVEFVDFQSMFEQQMPSSDFDEDADGFDQQMSEEELEQLLQELESN